MFGRLSLSEVYSLADELKGGLIRHVLSCVGERLQICKLSDLPNGAHCSNSSFPSFAHPVTRSPLILATMSKEYEHAGG